MIQHLSSKLDKVLWFLRTLQKKFIFFFKTFNVIVNCIFYEDDKHNERHKKKKEVNVTNCWSGLN